MATVTPMCRSDHPAYSVDHPEQMPLPGATHGYPTLHRAMHTKRLSMKRYLALLLAGLVVSCGGGSDGGSTGGSNSGGGSNTGTFAAAGAHIEESDAPVTLSDGWTSADSRFGWSGGAAVRSSTAGATATVTFRGTSVRWISARGRAMGKARVRVDGGPAKE